MLGGNEHVGIRVDARTEARSARGVLRAKSESKAKNARELRAKPKSRAKPEIEQMEGSEEGAR